MPGTLGGALAAPREVAKGVVHPPEELRRKVATYQSRRQHGIVPRPFRRHVLLAFRILLRQV